MELLVEFVTGLGVTHARSSARGFNAESGNRVSAIPDADHGCGRLLVTGGVERCDQVIRSIEFVLLQRHDARGGCGIVRHRTAAMELEHGVGFVDCDDNPDGLHQRAVRHPLASETVTKCAGRELFKGQAAATRSGFPLIWGHHVMGTPPHINFS